jgi:hypothetical protein
MKTKWSKNMAGSNLRSSSPALSPVRSLEFSRYSKPVAGIRDPSAIPVSACFPIFP